MKMNISIGKMVKSDVDFIGGLMDECPRANYGALFDAWEKARARGRIALNSAHVPVCITHRLVADYRESVTKKGNLSQRGTYANEIIVSVPKSVRDDKALSADSVKDILFETKMNISKILDESGLTGFIPVLDSSNIALGIEYQSEKLRISDNIKSKKAGISAKKMLFLE